MDILHKKIFLLVLCLLSFLSDFPGYSQSLFKPARIDTTYIVDYRDKLTTRFYFLREGISFSINPEEIAPEIRYRPNTHSRLGIAGFYKWLGLSMTVETPLFAKKREEQRGRSRILDLRANAYMESVVGEISYQKYNSFYLSNPGNVVPSWKSGMDYPQRPDMSIHSVNAIIYYILNHKRHSLKAVFLQNMRQKRSSGSLVCGPAFIYLRVHADSGLVPDQYIASHHVRDELNIRKGYFTTSGLYLGYSYTLVFFKYFYINASLLPGYYFKTYNYNSDIKHYQGNSWSILWIARSAVGYNSDSWYFGLGGVTGFQSEPLPLGNFNFNMDLSQFRIWVGTRFNIFVKNK